MQDNARVRRVRTNGEHERVGEFEGGKGGGGDDGGGVAGVVERIR